MQREYASEDVCDLMNRLMQYAPEDRITAAEVREGERGEGEGKIWEERS